ncbi:MAG: hypothetical protein KDD40_06890 [Bdellovibrionales bacterium]|nr:hypothetical protein [Bdellovibrionales bacterium]
MAKFMINICYGDIEKRKNSTHQFDDQFIMNKYREWSEKLASKTLSAHKLKDGEGRKVELIGKEVKDGPFTETKESIGGFYIVETDNYNEAVELAKGCPTLLYQGGYIEVREVEF